jgi:glycosyltransferase involved in cell wall biosynthesis
MKEVVDKVSVIMPCYNDGLYLEESVKSVLGQTHQNLELIIIDDGSDDPETLRILNENQWERTTILRTARLRPAGARNYGISRAIGKYILPVDSDDMIEADYIEKAVKLMQEDLSIGAVYCYADLFGEKTGRWDLPDYSLEAMLLDNIVFVTALFCKEDWEKVGGFNTKYTLGMEDYDFWLSILELDKKIVQIPEVLFHYRIKPVSRTTRFQKDVDVVVETYKQLYKNHPKFYEKYRDEYALVLREALIHQFFVNRSLREQVEIFEKISRNPILKNMAKLFKPLIKKVLRAG